MEEEGGYTLIGIILDMLILPIILLVGEKLYKKISEYKNKKEEVKEVENIEEECNICSEEGVIIRLECHEEHKMCIKCIIRINRCPYCRKEINKIYVRMRIIREGIIEKDNEKGKMILRTIGIDEEDIKILRCE